MTLISIPTIETKDAHDLALATWGLMCDGLLSPLVEEHGQDKALEILRPYIEKLGESAPVFAQMMGISGNDAVAIASVFLLYEDQVLKVEGKVTEASSERVVKQSTRCPFQNCTSGFCWAFTIMAQGMAKAINSDYGVTVTKVMTEGDEMCEWIVEKE